MEQIHAYFCFIVFSITPIFLLFLIVNDYSKHITIILFLQGIQWHRQKSIICSFMRYNTIYTYGLVL